MAYDDTAESNPRKDIVTIAKERFHKAQDFYGQSRQQAVEDTRFAMGDSDNGWQWPEEIRQGRASSQRVVLTVNLTAQHCNQIINNIRQNRPSSKVSPVDDGADKKTAEILEGLLRNIKASSCADEAHDIAAEHAIYGGEGYWRIRLDWQSPDSFEQEIIIDALPNPNLVYVDCYACRPDRLDAEWGFIFEDISKEEFKREYPNIDPSSWGEEGVKTWHQEDTVRRAEYYYCEFTDDKLLLLSDGSTAYKSEFDKDSGLIVVKERDTQRKSWKWCMLVGGEDEPVEERDWPGDYLPIVTVVGKELNVDGEIVRKGIVRDLKDSARMVNYAYSETVQSLALQNKVPYLIADEAIGNNKDIWSSANIENYAYLPWQAYTDDGKSNPKPERQSGATMATAQVQLLQLSTEQMRAASGQQNANFGIRSEASSGVGIQRLKAQGEIATFHFPDNLARALRYEDVVLIDLIQKTYDVPKVIRIIGIDGQMDQAQVNPDMEQAFAEVQQAQSDVSKIFNPSIGKYDVVIDTGPSYQTMRQEGADRLVEMTTRNPQIMQVAGDIVMRAQDFPMSEELARRLEKTIPPNLMEDDDQQVPPQVKAILGQAQQREQEMQGVIQQLVEKLQEFERGDQLKRDEMAMKDAQHQRDTQVDAATTVAKIEADTAKARSSDETKLLISKSSDETKLLISRAQEDNRKDIADLTEVVKLIVAHIQPPPLLEASVAEDLVEDEGERE
jgi:hypothetical protein